MQEVKAGGVIRGRITSLDTGKPLRRAQVRLASENEFLGTPRTASTSTDGRYEFRDVPPGRYTLRVERSGYLALTYGQRRPGEQGRPLEIAEKEVADKVDFALPRMSVISGRVLDDLGEPIAGVTVWVLQTRYLPGPAATRRDWRQRAHRHHGSVPAAVTCARRLRRDGNDSRDLAARQRSEAGLRLCAHLFSRDVLGGPGTARQAWRRPGNVRHRFQPGGGPDLDACSGTATSASGLPLGGETVTMMQRDRWTDHVDGVSGGRGLDEGCGRWHLDAAKHSARRVPPVDTDGGARQPAGAGRAAHLQRRRRRCRGSVARRGRGWNGPRRGGDR